VSLRDGNRRAVLVATTAARHRVGRIGPGARLARVRAAHRGLRRVGVGLYRSGTLVFGVRRGRVRYLAVAGHRTARDAAALRRHLRRAGMR
jgi:hypothetical protein